MMVSPESYIDEIKDKSYKELLKERDELLEEIKDFEEAKELENENMIEIPEIIIDPSPEVVYQCNLEYLGELCKLISEKYNKEFIWREENE